MSTNFFSRNLSTSSATKAITGSLGATTLLLLSAFLFPYLPEQVSAEEQGTTATLALDSTVSITIPSTIEMDVAPTTSGTFTSTTSTPNITTNNPSGYDLYLSAADGDNVLRNENPSVQNTINPTTDGVTSTTMSNNTWGYNLSGGSSTQTPDTYNAVPIDGTTALDSTTTPSTTNYNLTFGAKVDTSIASGTYSSEVIISAVAKPVLITINFNGNGADGGSMDSIQLQAGESQVLPQNTFARTDYAFIGWNTQTDGQGTSYTNQADFTAPDNGELAITLYAQWGPSIQDFTNTKCQSLANTDNYTVYDERDGNGYTVRYINGACWMTQNLRLSGGRTLTSADSNVASSWSFPSTPLAGSSSSYTDPQVTISSNTSYGGYYNYCAASAGTVCSQTQASASQSICPKGWELPTRTQFDAIAGNSSYSSAFSPVLSGYYDNGSLSNTGNNGYWWSATANNNNRQYRLNYNGGSLYTIVSYKVYGNSVRCIRSS